MSEDTPATTPPKDPTPPPAPEAKPEAEAKAEAPEAKPETDAKAEAPGPEPELKPEAEAKAEAPEAEAKPEAEARPEPEAKPEEDAKAPEPKAEPEAKPEPEVKPEKAESKPEDKPEAEPEAEAKPEPEADAKAEPASQPEPEAKSEPTPKPESDEATPDAEAKAQTEPPASAAEPEAKPDEAIPEAEAPKAEAGAEAKPEAEAKAPEGEPEPEAKAEPAASAAEPTAEPEAQADEATPEAEAAPEPEAPAAAPKPRPIPRPMPPRGGQVAAATPTRPLPVPPPVSDEELREAATFGRVDEEGTVYVREGSRERAVGQYPGVPEAEAIALYVRRYADLRAQLSLFEARIDSLSIKEIDQNLATLKQALHEPAAVGNTQSLRDHLGRVREKANQARSRIEGERRAAKEKALTDRQALVAKAEALAEKDPEKVQWRQAWDTLNQILTDWKTLQAQAPRIDHAAEDDLWKRLSKARATLDRKRRHFYSEQEKRFGAAKAAKEQIVAEAEKLANSREWGQTAAAFRGLMDRWRDAGRAARKDDDALWAGFQAARETFFSARDSHFEAADSEQKTNLEAKLAIIADAEKLLPIKDLQAAKSAMRRLQDKFDEIGHVPRSEMSAVEARMKAVEDAIRSEEDDRWKRSNPEARARTQSMVSQLEATIAELRTQLLEAQASQDSKKVASVKEALAAREAWLEQVHKSASDLD